MRKIATSRDSMNKPYVVCHMLTSLDGKIDGAFMATLECAPALAAYSNLREFYECQATLYGTVTMAGSYSDGLAGKLPVSEITYPKEDYIAVLDAAHYIVSVDPKGTLGWKFNYIEKKNRPKAHVIEVLTEVVSNDYLAYLHKFDISYIFAGKEQLDCGLLLEKIHGLFTIDRLMIAGGGFMNWSFLHDDLIDELSIVIAPVADGNNTSVSIFEKSEFLPERIPAAFSLQEAQKLEGDCLWLRYIPKA